MTEYKLVPVEPTLEMVEAAYARTDWGPPGYDDAPDGAASAEKTWAAMLSAAPSPDGEEVETLRRIVHDTLGYTSTNDAKFQALAAAISAMRPMGELTGHGPFTPITVDATSDLAAIIAEGPGDVVFVPNRPTLSAEDRARVDEVRAVLVSANEYWNGSRTDGAMSDALDVIEQRITEALSLIDKLTEAG